MGEIEARLYTHITDAIAKGTRPADAIRNFLKTLNAVQFTFFTSGITSAKGLLDVLCSPEVIAWLKTGDNLSDFFGYLRKVAIYYGGADKTK